jgi:hypothetical protein
MFILREGCNTAATIDHRQILFHQIKAIHAQTENEKQHIINFNNKKYIKKIFTRLQIN